MENCKIFDSSGDEMLIAQHPLTFWEENYLLPVHLYYAPIIRRNLRAFKQVLAAYYPKSRVCFAAKACTHPAVLKIVQEEGCGSDVASYNETRAALEGGIAPFMLDLNGNCKEDFLIEDAIEKGMNIVADSFEELKRVAEIAAKMHVVIPVILRVSGFELEQVTDDSVFTAGTWTKFGAALLEIPAFLATLNDYPSVSLIGFHTHIGSQISMVKPYLSVMGKLIELGHLLQRVGRPCKVLNIGGGFPVAYVDKTSWDYIVARIKAGYVKSLTGDMSEVFVWHDGLAGFAGESDPRIHLGRWTGERFYTEYPKEKMLEALLKGEVRVFEKTSNTVTALKELGEPLLTIEPGRSIVEDCGVTLARVGIVKKVAQHHNLVNLEMGVTSHGESLIERPVKKWEIVNDYKRQDPQPFTAFVGGNLCFSGDMISKYKVFFQRQPVRGDVVLIHNTGAYTSSLFSANSNSFPRPARLLVDENGEIVSLKRRDTYEEIIQK